MFCQTFTACGKNVSARNVSRYVPNSVLHTDLQIPTVKAEITNFSTKYREKLITHPNELTPTLLEEEDKHFKPTELTTRFSKAPYHRYHRYHRTSDVRIFNGILLHKSCNISVGC
jgi:hypothetical protein